MNQVLFHQKDVSVTTHSYIILAQSQMEQVLHTVSDKNYSNTHTHMKNKKCFSHIIHLSLIEVVLN